MKFDDEAREVLRDFVARIEKLEARVDELEEKQRARQGDFR